VLEFQLALGVRVEALDKSWAAYSPVSGETLLLNTEAAAILDVLGDGPITEAGLAAVLAAEVETPIEVVSRSVSVIWPQLFTAGFVQTLSSTVNNGG
jgi:hypothetical protein